MKKVVAILVNDIHLNKDNGELVKDIFRQLIAACRKHDAKDIIIGGDIFTSRSGQPLQCLIDFQEIITMVADENIRIHAIPGNHDKTDSESENSYLDIYKHKNFILYKRGGVRKIGYPYFAFIPYFPDEIWLKEYEKVNDELQDCDVKILITHSGFDGVRNNDGTEVSSPIKPKMFKEWDKVLIGHYHNASSLTDNVIYTGSAYQNNYGETIDDKGFTLIYDDGSVKKVRSRFPKYIKEIVDVNDKDRIAELLDEYADSRDNVRFVFRGTKVDCEKINIAEIKRKYGIDCKFECTEVSSAISAVEEEAVLSYDKKTLVKDFLQFCKDNNITGEKMKYGLNLVKSI